MLRKGPRYLEGNMNKTKQLNSEKHALYLGTDSLEKLLFWKKEHTKEPCCSLQKYNRMDQNDIMEEKSGH